MATTRKGHNSSAGSKVSLRDRSPPSLPSEMSSPARKRLFVDSPAKDSSATTTVDREAVVTNVTNAVVDRVTNNLQTMIRLAVDAPISTHLERLKEDVTEELKRISGKMRNEVSELARRENDDLRTRIGELKHMLYQQSTACSLVVSGRPEDKHEDAIETALNLFNKDLGLDLEEANIQESFRLRREPTKPPSRPRSILVRLHNPTTKARVMAKRKELKTKRPIATVFVNDDLTPLKKVPTCSRAVVPARLSEQQMFDVGLTERA